MNNKFKALPHSCVYEYQDEVSGNNYMVVVGLLHPISPHHYSQWWGEAFKNGSSVVCYSSSSIDTCLEYLTKAALEA